MLITVVKKQTCLLGSESSPFVPGSESSRELSFPGTKVPENFRSRERKFSVGTFAPRSENTEERKVLLPSPCRRPPSGGAGRPKFNQLEMWWSLPLLQTQFGEDRCTQCRVIVVTDPQKNKPTHRHTNRQDWLQYTALQLVSSVLYCLAYHDTVCDSVFIAVAIRSAVKLPLCCTISANCR